MVWPITLTRLVLRRDHTMSQSLVVNEIAPRPRIAASLRRLYSGCGGLASKIDGLCLEGGGLAPAACRASCSRVFNTNDPNHYTLSEDVVHLLPYLLTPRRFQIAHRGLHVRSVRATAGRCVDRRQPTNSGLRRSRGICEARSSLCRASRGQQQHHAFGGVVAIQVNLNVCHS